MGRRGPKPDPLALQKVLGFPGKRKPRKPVEPPLNLPEPPAHLDEQAVLTWQRLGPVLLRLGLMTEADGDAFAGYCQAYSAYLEAVEYLKTHGSTYPMRDKDGRPRCYVPYPQVAIARAMLRECRAFQAEFGMTPSSRARLNIDLPSLPGDEDEKLANEILGPARIS